MTKRILVYALAVAIAAAVATPVRAAYLVKKDEDRSEERTEPQETLTHCMAQAMANLSVTVGGGLADLELACDASGQGTDPTCDTLARITGSVMILLEIMPDVGESPGDPVTMCVAYSATQESQDEGDFQVQSTIGGIPLTQPLTIKKGLDTLLAVFRDGPATIRNGSREAAYECHFDARIGDDIELRAGFDIFAKGSGIGSGAALKDVDVHLFMVDGCEELPPCLKESVPAMSGLPAGAIAVLLAAAGGTLIRWRSRRRRE